MFTLWTCMCSSRYFRKCLHYVHVFLVVNISGLFWPCHHCTILRNKNTISKIILMLGGRFKLTSKNIIHLIVFFIYQELYRYWGNAKWRSRIEVFLRILWIKSINIVYHNILHNQFSQWMYNKIKRKTPHIMNISQ